MPNSAAKHPALLVGGSIGAPPSMVMVPSLAALVHDAGHHRMTFLQPYGVPSGGDWSIHCGAALFVEDGAGCCNDED